VTVLDESLRTAAREDYDLEIELSHAQIFFSFSFDPRSAGGSKYHKVGSSEFLRPFSRARIPEQKDQSRGGVAYFGFKTSKRWSIGVSELTAAVL